MIKLHKIGADIELLFVDGGGLTLPAHRIFQANGRIIDTYVGTDGHPATGEIRPPPSHNINQILYKVAYALDAIQRFLIRSSSDARMCAAPVVNNEPLGGHIHVSLFASMDNPVVGPETIDAILSYLNEPCEGAVQPWQARLSRMSRYGVRDVRIGNSQVPSGQKKQLLYYHYEYRTPSTWLAHPSIGYTYLALVKLTMLNFSAVSELAHKEPRDVLLDVLLNRKVANKSMETVLRGRLEKLASLDTLKRTPDLCGLESALAESMRLREKLFSRVANVDIEAWRKLL